MVDRAVSRRGVLRAGGVAGAAALSGCGLLSSGSDLGGSRTGYATWVPEAGALHGFESTIANFQHYDQLRDHEAALSYDLDSLIEEHRPDVGGVSTNDTDGLITTNGTMILTGSFDAEAFVDEFTSLEEWSRADSYSGYEFVVADEQEYTYAVDASALLFTRSVEGAKTLIDVNSGATDGATQTSDAFARLVDALGTATYGRLYIDYRYDESETSALTTGTWFGQAMTVEGKTTTFDFVYLVDGEPETEAVEQLLTDVEAHDVSGVDNSVSSNTIEVTGSFETAKLTQDLTDLTLGDAYSLVYPLPGGN